jgi:hypothetical protein
MLVIAELQVPGTVGRRAVRGRGFIVLSVIAHRSARDFTWLGASLRWFGVLALVAIVLAVLTGQLARHLVLARDDRLRRCRDPLRDAGHPARGAAGA